MQPLPTYAAYFSTYGFVYTDAYYYLFGYFFQSCFGALTPSAWEWSGRRRCHR